MVLAGAVLLVSMELLSRRHFMPYFVLNDKIDATSDIKDTAIDHNTGPQYSPPAHRIDTH
jgi:hypothetical protein